MLAARRVPRQQRSRETVAVILEAAAQVFEREGYRSATTNKIAERAGVSIGSLYQYFPNKDALLVALAEHELAASTRLTVARLAQLGGDRASPERLLRELLETLAAAHARRPQLHRLLFTQTPRRPELLARFSTAQQEIAASLAEQLRRLGNDTHPELTALLAVQGITAQLHGAVLDPPAGLSWQECVDQMATQWGRVLAEPGFSPHVPPKDSGCGSWPARDGGTGQQT